MTKKEQNQQITRLVMEMLILKYNAYNIEDEEGGRIAFYINSESDNTFRGEYHRTYKEIIIYENRKLIGNNWSIEEISIAEEAKKYEEVLNDEIKKITNHYKIK